jgi:hypothetical protein
MVPLESPQKDGVVINGGTRMVQATVPLTSRQPLDFAEAPTRNGAHSSGVLWAAVIAGALLIVLIGLFKHF